MADALSEVRIIHRIQSEAWTSSWCLTRKKQWIGYYKRKRKSCPFIRTYETKAKLCVQLSARVQETLIMIYNRPSFRRAE